MFWIGHVANVYNGTNGDAGLIAVDYPSYWNPQRWVRITSPDTNSNYNEQYQINAVATSRKGIQVCLVGAFTGSHCGSIQNTNFQYTSATLHQGMVLANICGVISGDSGGAVYTGHAAYGTTASGIPGQCAVAYEPATRAQNQFGVTILY